MTLFGLAESSKTMNRPDPTVTLVDGLFLGNYKRLGCEILTQSSFKSSICALIIEDLNECCVKVVRPSFILSEK